MKNALATVHDKFPIGTFFGHINVLYPINFQANVAIIY